MFSLSSALRGRLILSSFIIVVLLLVLTPGGMAQGASTVTFDWTRQFGGAGHDYGWGAVADESGVYVAGYTDGALAGQTSLGGNDVFVRKYDSGGNELWTHQFGTGLADEGHAIAIDGSGVYVVGRTEGTLPGQTNQGAGDLFVRKYDLNGVEQWTRQFGTADGDFGLDIAADGTSIYITGWTGGTFAGQTSSGWIDAFVVAYDANGFQDWTVQFGSASHDYGTAITVDGTGVYVAGHTDGTLPGKTSAGGRDVFVHKLNLDGSTGWTHQFGSAVTDEGMDIASDGSAVYVSGAAGSALPGQTHLGQNDAFVRTYDASGTELWTRQFGTSNHDIAWGIAADGAGVYVSGFTNLALPGQSSSGNDDAFLSKYSPGGSEEWTAQFGSSNADYGLDVSVVGSALYVAGQTYGALAGQTASGNADTFVVKLTEIPGAAADLALSKVVDNPASAVGAQVTFTVTLANNGPQEATGIAVTDQAPAGLTFDSVTPSQGSYDGGTGVWNAGALTSGSSATLAVVATVNHSGTSINTAAVTASDLSDPDAGNNEASAMVEVGTGSANLEWTGQSGGPNNDYAYDTAVDGSAIYVTGSTDGTLPGQSNQGRSDAFVRQFDLDGNILWTDQFGSGDHDSAQAVAVSGAAIYVTGYTQGALPDQTSIGGAYDAFLRKYDLNGNVAWTVQFGSTGGDMGEAVAADGSGIYVVGWTDGALPGQSASGSLDAFVRKYDPDGNVLWTHQFGSAAIDVGQGIDVDSSAVYVAGWTTGALPGQSSAGGTDTWVSKYDLDGAILWTRQFGTGASDFGLGIAVGGAALHISGWTSGAFSDQSNVGATDIFVRTYDLAGNKLWTRQFGSAAIDDGRAIAVDGTAVYIAGYTAGALPGEASSGGNDVFVRTYHLDGSLGWTRQFGSNSMDYGRGIAVDGSAAYIAGYTFGVLPGVASSGGSDAFLIKLRYGPSNQSPIANAGGPYGGFEGTPIALDGSASSEPDGDSLGFSWTVDSAACTFDDATLQSPFLTCLDNSSYAVTLEVSDGQAINSAPAAVQVDNVVPAVGPITTPVDPVLVNTSITASASFNDSGALDTHTAVWDWGDGTASAGAVVETGGTGSVSDSHTYTTPGVFTVKLTVTDKDGSVAESTYQYVVVYDPDGGFATGAGLIQSAAGACQDASICTDVEGVAHFGFVSKYKNGATVPTGNTQFRFQAGNLRFHSDTYGWLVITGSNYAKFKGSGMINDGVAPNNTLYKFQIWAGDKTTAENEDTFRIKIWYEDNGTEIVVYDNGMDQPISSGNIQVNTK